MIALLALAAGTAIGIAVQAGSGQTCPSSEQVSSALWARLPASKLGDAGQGDAKPMRLRLEGLPEALQIQLRDADGVAVLSRVLQPNADRTDCLALADTVALIVERYLDELEVKRLEAAASTAPVPVAPVSPRRWLVGLGAIGRSGQTSILSAGTEISLERQLGGRWSVAAAGGALWPNTSTTSGAGTPLDVVTISRFSTWAKLRAGPAWGFGIHSVGVKGEAGLGLVRASRGNTAGMGPTAVAWGWEPWVGSRLHYRAHLGPAWFVEAAVGATLALVRHQLVVRLDADAPPTTVATTARLFTDVGLSLGVEF